MHPRQIKVVFFQVWALVTVEEYSPYSVSLSAPYTDHWAPWAPGDHITLGAVLSARSLVAVISEAEL